MASTIGSLTVGSTVKIKESGRLVDFLIVQHNVTAESPTTFRGSKLVRKDIHSTQVFSYSNPAKYRTSSIRSWLNGTYANYLDSALRAKMPYIYSYSSSNLDKICLPGGGETYFNTNAKRIAYFNNEATGWWVLSDRSTSNYTRYITTSGTFDDTAASYTFVGARPCFLLPSTMYVTSSGQVAIGSPPQNIASISTTASDSIAAGESITISWTPTSDSDGDLTGYILERSENESEPWEQIYTGAYTTVNYTDTAPAKSENVSTIRYRVKAYDAEGLESNYTTSSAITVINNVAPSAPGSISASNVVANGSATITWTAATDTDGTISSYTLERKVDGNEFTQIYNGTALTTTDTISDEWGTVQYRVKATDNDGGVSDYTTSTTYTVNSGFLILNGPDFSMGNKTAPFNFEFSISTSDSTTVNDITAVVTLDNVQIYSDTPNTGETVSIPIDTRLLGTGSHVVNVTVSKTDYLGVSYSYTFTIPSFEISDEGIAQQFQNSQGVSIFPVTLARYVIGKNGQDVNTLIGDGLKIKSGYYTGTGTFGSANLNSLTFDFVPKFLMITNRNNAGFCPLMVYGQPGTYCQVGSTTGYLTTTWGNDSGKTVKWYGTSAELQLNNSGQHYVYVAIG